MTDNQKARVARALSTSTGANMLECFKALSEAGYDTERARQLLRVRMVLR